MDSKDTLKKAKKFYSAGCYNRRRLEFFIVFLSILFSCLANAQIHIGTGKNFDDNTNTKVAVRDSINNQITIIYISENAKITNTEHIFVNGNVITRHPKEIMAKKTPDSKKDIAKKAKQKEEKKIAGSETKITNIIIFKSNSKKNTFYSVFWGSNNIVIPVNQRYEPNFVASVSIGFETVMLFLFQEERNFHIRAGATKSPFVSKNFTRPPPSFS